MATKNTKKRTAKKAAVAQRSKRKNLPRKRRMFVRVRKDQRGTPMESFILNNATKFEKGNINGKYMMKHTDVPKGIGLGTLKRAWSGRYNTGTKARNIRKYMDTNNVGRREAKQRLNRLFVVSFGSEPHNK